MVGFALPARILTNSASRWFIALSMDASVSLNILLISADMIFINLLAAKLYKNYPLMEIIL
jgi:hypothetical protein